jgi:hypothetical protein
MKIIKKKKTTMALYSKLSKFYLIVSLIKAVGNNKLFPLILLPTQKTDVPRKPKCFLVIKSIYFL